MKKRRSFLFLLILFIVYKSSGQDFQITQLKLEFYGNQLHITYNIDSKNLSDKFRITVEINRQNGEPVQPKSITGEIGGNIKSGNNKRIIWDLEKDAIYLDEDISVELKCEKLSKPVSKGSLILMSTVLPGLGQTKMSGKPWWLVGVASYGALAGGFIFHKSYLNTYDSYKDEKDPFVRADLQDQAQKKLNISNTLFVTAASLWVANIIWVAVTPNSNQPLKHVRVYIKPVIMPYNEGAIVSLRVDF
jgi:hypothetical protein